MFITELDNVTCWLKGRGHALMQVASELDNVIIHNKSMEVHSLPQRLLRYVREAITIHMYNSLGPNCSGCTNDATES